MSLGNEISRSREAPRGYPLFPPRWAMEHLTNEQYREMRKEHNRKYGIKQRPRRKGK
jgi:hypothetical protein